MFRGDASSAHLSANARIMNGVERKTDMATILQEGLQQNQKTATSTMRLGGFPAMTLLVVRR